MNEHSDPSAPKPDDASSRPAPPLTPPADEATADPFAAPGGATDKPTATDAATPAPPHDVPSATAVDRFAAEPPAPAEQSEPPARATDTPAPADVPSAPGAGPSAVSGSPGAVGADPSVLAAAAGIQPPSTAAASAAQQPSVATPGGGHGAEPVTRAVPAGPLPPRIEPRGDAARHGGPPHAGAGVTPPPMGPPTSTFPAGPPPMGGAPYGSAPPKKKSKAPALVAAALVIALGAGTAGGVAGYALSAAGGGNDSSSPSELVADGNTISDIAKKVQPSVVSIATEQAGGSGVVYDDQGHIITNNHVAETASGGKLEVTFADGSTAAASVVGTDPAGDLAVIKVDDVGNLTPIEMGDSGSLDVGDTVLAIGSPLGLDGSVTSGIVSALDRTVQAGGGEQGGQATTLNGLIQTDAAINPGNSGGALVNGKGELIGINTVIATTGSSEGSVGLGFAIPSSTVSSTAEQIIEGGDVEHGYLGVSVTDNVSGTEGAVVNEVAGDSPADKAGLERGDVITVIDGEKVTGAADVGSVVQSAEPGTKVDIKYTRDGKEESTTAELGSTGSTG